MDEEHNTRLYRVIYGTEGEEFEEVFPEWALPTLSDVQYSEFIGYLAAGFVVLEDNEEDPGEKEPINKPLLLVNL